MPGPNSKPWARTASGRVVSGKSALRSAGLRSREGIGKNDYAGMPATKRKPRFDRSKDESER
jgi:hypothetical protein